MKIMLRIWILGALGAIAFAQSSQQYLTQGAHYDSEEALHRPSDTRYFRLRSHEPESHDEIPVSDPRHYQSIEQYQQPSPVHYPSYQPQHQSPPHQLAYHQPEDPSYHRAQEISHHEPRHQYPQAAVQYEDQSHISRHEPRQQYPRASVQYEDQSHVSPHEPRQRYQRVAAPQYEEHDQGSYHEPRQQHQQAAPQYEELQHGSHPEPEARETPNHDRNANSEDVQEPSRSRSSSHPAPLPVDPKLPLYFTMYEKRVLRDPLSKYGKGPWRYLTHGYGITYGSKEPGKVFEKGYGYIRALGRDHCNLPEHLCPPTDETPFEYEGRKEPYFGYRPH